MRPEATHPGRRTGKRRTPKLSTAALAFALFAIAAVAGAQQTISRYAIEVAAHPTQEAAELEAEELRRALGPDLQVRVKSRPPSFTVLVGYFATVDDARAVLPRLADLGYEDASITPVLTSETEPVLEGPATRTDTEVQRERAAPEEGAVAGAGAAPPAPEPGSAAAPADDPPLPTRRERDAPPAAKRIQAMPIPEAPPAIDGRLDEPAWASALFVSDFQQKGAKRGFPPAEQTEVAFLYDDRALYVGARIHARNGSVIRTDRTGRDDGSNSDRIIVSLDTYRNRETAYNFGVTAGGARLDYYQPTDVFEVRDYSFDPVWEARTAVGREMWTAEMRIPFSSLQFHRGDAQIWGVNVQRVSPAERLYAFWVVVPGDETGWSSRFGDLVGLSDVRPARRVAVVPYVTGRSVSADAAAGDPFADGDDSEWDYGGDVLIDLTPGLSLEATFNPDFGQIEADPAVVNLTDYEVFFPEKRPFFVEGSQLLQGPGPRYFYSRRIGAPPHLRPNGDFFDQPATTTIEGAAKLIGRLPGGRSIGALVALTDDESATVYDPDTQAFDSFGIEPSTFFGVGRWQRDFGAGSSFGFGGTGVSRDLPESGALSDLLARQAYAGGFDWNLRFAGQSHEFGGFAGGSYVEGDAASILRLQTSSARYYQRPDADYVDLDPTRTDLSGYTAGMHLGRIQGAWRWAVGGEARSPGFEINDAGAMATADDLVSFGQMSYGRPLRGLFRRVDLSTSLTSGWNFGGVRQFTTPAADLSLVWRNFWQTYVRVAHDTPALSDSLTRGGPLMETPATWRGQLGISSNDALRRVWSLDGTYSTDDLGGWSYSARTRFLARLTDRISVSVTPGYERALDARQYFSTIAGGPEATFGRRYVFAELDRSTVYARFRLGLNFSGDLGLDVYAEPFSASGSYARFGQLAAAETSDLRIYGTDGTTITELPDGSLVVTDGTESFTLANGDFDVSSFRANVVLHWDYAPGSTIFLLWQQNRQSEGLFGEPAAPEDLIDIFDAPSEDVFAIKASYRLNLAR